MPNSSWTETGSSISLVPTTTTIDGGSSTENVNYLTNSDKIALMAQYSAELQIKTTLDTAASGLSVPTTNYDNAVANINTTLLAAGAPTNWATIWPDGTTFGPSAGIQTALSGDWAGIAASRTSLQTAISETQAALQAAAAQATAIATAATNALATSHTMALTAPSTATWSSAAKPALPSGTYPPGSCWLSTDGFEFQVSAAGSAWEAVVVAASGLFGQITAAQLLVADWTNLCYNPGFEDGLTQWTLNTGSVSISTSGGVRTGSKCVVFSDGSGASAITNNNRVPCNPGQQFMFEMWAVRNALGTSGDVSARITFIDNTGVSTGNVDVHGVPGAGSFARIVATLVAPINSAYATCVIVSWSPVGTNFYVDDCYFRRMDDASVIVDGSITASKLVTGTAQIDIVNAGGLNAAVANIYNLNASNITTGTLSASRVLFPDGSALTTASRVTTQSNSLSANVVVNASTTVPLSTIAFSFNCNGAADVFSISASLYVTSTALLNLVIGVTIDGSSFVSGRSFLGVSGLTSVLIPYFANISGLAAGSHTLVVTVSNSSLASCQVQNSFTYAQCLHVF